MSFVLILKFLAVDELFQVKAVIIGVFLHVGGFLICLIQRVVGVLFCESG